MAWSSDTATDRWSTTSRSSVAAGEIVALLGPNGAGKTTTVEIVEGYRRADGGQRPRPRRGPGPRRAALRARVGLMLQAGGIDMRARPRETLHQHASFHAEPRDPDALLELVGLAGVATTRYRRLSGGERQRLGLALALVGQPEVVILDEPTAGMDPEGRAATRRIVSDSRDEGVAVLLTSHDLADVERLADRIHVLVGGRVVAAGTPAELAAGLQPRLRLRMDRPLDEAELGGLRAATAAARSRSMATATGSRRSPRARRPSRPSRPGPSGKDASSWSSARSAARSRTPTSISWGRRESRRPVAAGHVRAGRAWRAG